MQNGQNPFSEAQEFPQDTRKAIFMNPIAEFVKENRKAAGLTQEQFALRSGLGLRFVRELEQGKETVRMDKVNVALAMFNAQAVPGKKEIKFDTRDERQESEHPHNL